MLTYECQDAWVMTLTIGSRKVCRDEPPFIIGEISGNHLGSLARCIELVKVAAEAGVSAVKVQTIDPAKITIDTDDERFIVQHGPWKGRRAADIFREAMLPREWHAKIFEYAKSLGVYAFSTPFDLEAVDFLDGLDVPAFKIASNEIFDWPLLKAICKTGKPMIISTGAARESLIKQTYDYVRRHNARELALLHCVSAYPADYNEMYLNTIQCLKLDEEVEVGLSDHTLGVEASISAVALGATVIEKHITMNRDEGGLDSHFSLEPEEICELVRATRNAWESTKGGIKFGGERNLDKAGIFTRQLWSKKRINAGQTLDWENVKSVRAPMSCNGVPPYKYEELIGRIANSTIECNEPIPEDWL